MILKRWEPKLRLVDDNNLVVHIEAQATCQACQRSALLTTKEVVLYSKTEHFPMLSEVVGICISQVLSIWKCRSCRYISSLSDKDASRLSKEAVLRMGEKWKKKAVRRFMGESRREKDEPIIAAIDGIS